MISERPNPFDVLDTQQTSASIEFRERFFLQEPALLEAANQLAATIRATPPNPEFPDNEPRALAVGGFVRDTLLGLHPKDLDIEVYGVPSSRLKSLLEQLFPERINLVGESFGIMKVALSNGYELDVSIPRRESKTGEGHKGFSIAGDPSMSVEEAARRRDFTMNSVAADLLTGELVDTYGGVADIKHHILRVTDEKTFQEDPLRVYRAMQFIARMHLTVDPKSLELMQQMVQRGDLHTLAPERITEEWKKLLLKSETPSLGLDFLDAAWILDLHYPKLAALKDTPQEAEWHPEGDAWIHTKMVVDQAATISRRPEWKFTGDERLAVMIGALCHDLGKPSTTKIEDGRIRSRGHEEAGEEPTKELLRQLIFSNEIQQSAVVIAKEHLKPGIFHRELLAGRLSEKSYANAVRKLLKRIQPTSWRVLIAASEADHRGRALPGVDVDPYVSGIYFADVIQAQKLDQEGMAPLLRGNDLLAMGVKPGKRIGEIIKIVERLRDEGVLSTREEALDAARNEVQKV